MPAPVCFGCDVLYTALMQNARQDETIMVPKSLTSSPKLQRYSLWLCLFQMFVSQSQNPTEDFQSDVVAAGQCKKQEKAATAVVPERSTTAEFCANYVERGKRRTIFGAFGVEGSSSVRKCHLNASPPACKFQPGAMNHEVNCF